jgi:hypothetical protein
MIGHDSVTGLRRRVRLLTVVLALAWMVVAGMPAAAAGQHGAPQFTHIATFDVTDNGSAVAEIVDATRNGRSLVYTDSDNEAIGFVDIADPTAPRADGTLDVGGEPTSVAVAGQYALVAVNTSADFVDVSGSLLVVDLRTRDVVATLDLGGQPDAVAVSPDGRYAAVAIENERDEDLDGGPIPQLPAGELVIVDVTRGGPDRWTTRTVDLTGYADVAPSDPEPEFVDINKRNQAVVTLQENNHIVVVDLRSGAVTDDFNAGSVDLTDVDATEEELGPQEAGLISFSEDITRRREPDAVAWIGNDVFATANEGDYEDADGVEGSSRGFTLFDASGDVAYESAESYELTAAAGGHYPEGRSENKGVEPESAEYGRFFGSDLLFIGAERANALGVYDVSDASDPAYVQTLPTGIGPEGVKAIEQHGLLVVANETSVEGVPSMITIYATTPNTDSTYPQLVSADSGDGTPIPWVAMSGVVGDPADADTLYAVSDSFLAYGFIYTIDVSSSTATIVDRIQVTDPAGDMFFPDLEGVAVAPEGGFWLASEGRVGDRPNAIIRTDGTGTVLDLIELPAALTAGGTNSGFEGVAVTETPEGTTEYVYAVIQREWADDAENVVKIARYEVTAGEWTFVNYEKAAPTGAGWVGLSELTLLPDGTFAIVERDNQLGDAATIK